MSGKDPRCQPSCCRSEDGILPFVFYWADFPKPCLECGIGLVHRMLSLPETYRCDSCDLWRFKSDHMRHDGDCGCVLDMERQLCPHAALYFKMVKEGTFRCET